MSETAMVKPIQMVDLVRQYAHIQEEVDAALKGVMESAAFINGPEVQAFREELERYLDVKHVIPCANGTDALQIALMALGLEPGDEVIAPTFTFVATAEVIALLQLKPVLVDVDPDTFMLDLEQVEAAITPKTKAIIPVHLFGQCAPMEELMTLAEAKGLKVVEDTAQAIGSTYRFSNGDTKKAGTIGQIGCTSFFPSKNLGCFGDGGAVFTDDDELAEKMRQIANHGSKKRYYHDEIGVNSRLDSMQAAVLRIKLRRLEAYNKARQEAASFYDEALRSETGINIPVNAAYCTHVYHQYTLKINGLDREKLQAHLAEAGVPSMVYYPVPLHMQQAYLDERYASGDFPVAEALSKQVISLPMHTELQKDQLTLIVEKIKEFTHL